MEEASDHYHFKSISQLMRFLDYPMPAHPLVTLVNYQQVAAPVFEKDKKISLDFYKISFKQNFNGQIRYGQGYYDFEEGGLAFLKPNQIVISPDQQKSHEGFVLYFHPDLIRNYRLGQAIDQYGFFSYAISEALFLSAKEKETISAMFSTISNELANNIDQFSQDVLVSQLELLLNHSNRFYHRQFITRKNVNHEIVDRLNKLLENYFDEKKGFEMGLPSVHYVSGELKLSQRYLSDLLRSLTGYNTQQYLQDKVIEQSKKMLSSTLLSVAEVAYQLGFEHPQSFSKLFKVKTTLSPLVFRRSFDA